MIKKVFRIIASIYLLAICFYTPGFAQLQFSVQSYTCDENTYYLQLETAETLWIANDGDTLSRADFDSFSVKGRNLICEKPDPRSLSFTLKPKATGQTKIKARIKFKNGQKLQVKETFEVVAMPKLCLELSASSPDHTFIWLKIREEGSGKEVSNDYEICMLEYTLHNSAGMLKEEGVIASDQWFFPSISLQQISAAFELQDALVITASVIHKKYRLLNYIAPTTLIIEKLWH